ncbi:glutamic acid-rich protein-like [Parambassis ranga]|uniref:Glutamic acid-rich protein-like n=1 Tax=Parambassis ranga TaxID=210632 RepID=A0A6P7JG12_9TELE|nr:glutamic acid-rich protein-like [Parambassis ranga]
MSNFKEWVSRQQNANRQKVNSFDMASDGPCRQLEEQTEGDLVLEDSGNSTLTEDSEYSQDEYSGCYVRPISPIQQDLSEDLSSDEEDEGEVDHEEEEPYDVGDILDDWWDDMDPFPLVVDMQNGVQEAEDDMEELEEDLILEDSGYNTMTEDSELSEDEDDGG